MTLTAADTVPGLTEEAKKKKDLFGLIRVLLILLCVGIFAFCGYRLVEIFVDYRLSDDFYNDLVDEYRRIMDADGEPGVLPLDMMRQDAPMKNYADRENGGTDEPDPGPVIPHVISRRFQSLRVYIGNLKQSNPETYGNISVEGTKIFYPVVQAADNSFYLTHGFDGSPLKAGAIYVDFRNSRKVEDNRNLVIYGHNMQNGGMFHSLEKYLDEEFFKSTNIEVATLDGIYTFEVFAVYAADKYEPYYSTFFGDDAAFLKFCDQCVERSMYDKKMEFTPDDVILTLSTCVTGRPNERYAIHARLIKVET